MNKQFYLFMLSIFGVNVGFPQTNQGGRLTAMGNNGAAVKDIWGVAANPASITDIQLPSIQLNHQEHIFTKAVSDQALAFVVPANRQTFGLNLQRYGIPEYHNIKVGIVFTRQFGSKLAIGLRANYHQLKINNYGASTGISLDIGAIYQLSNELCFGFYISNPSSENYNTKAIDITIPTITYIGVAYRTSDKLLIATTISKENVSTGVDYQLIKVIGLRAGVSLNPFTHYFGIGFNISKIVTDFTFTKHPNFGYSPQLTIGYVF